MTNEKIEILADSVRVSGPKVDGSYSITFSIGDYQREQVAKILTLPQLQTLKLTVEGKNE